MLFRQPNEEHGIDLVSLNLQRAREMGVPGYMHYRKWCGLPTTGHWHELRDYVTNHTSGLYEGLYRYVGELYWYAGELCRYGGSYTGTLASAAGLTNWAGDGEADSWRKTPSAPGPRMIQTGPAGRGQGRGATGGFARGQEPHGRPRKQVRMNTTGTFLINPAEVALTTEKSLGFNCMAVCYADAHPLLYEICGHDKYRAR